MVMAFSLPQLVDFIVIRYEAYMEKHLIDFSRGCYYMALLQNMMPTDAKIASTDITVVDVAAYIYSVRSLSGENVYLVDLIHG